MPPLLEIQSPQRIVSLQYLHHQIEAKSTSASVSRLMATENQRIGWHSAVRILATAISDDAASRSLWPIAEDQVSRERGYRMAGKIAALFNMLTLLDVVALAPTERHSFAERCRFWAQLTERTRVDPQNAGVLAELRHGYRVD